MDANRIIIVFIAVVIAASVFFIQTQTGVPEQPTEETTSTTASTVDTTTKATQASSLPVPTSSPQATTTSSSLPHPSGDMEEVFFFYSPTCPHCVREKAFLEGLEAEHPGLVVHYILASENRELFSETASRYGTSTSGVPRTFIGDMAFVGFSPEDCGLQMYSGYNAYVGCANQIKAAIF